MAVWNTGYEATPAGTDSVAGGDDIIRSLKLETRTRASKDHAWAGGGPDDGYHIEGSARAFYVDADPTVLNSAATPTAGGGAALSSANSRGRLACYTQAGKYGIRVYDGSAWQDFGLTGAVANVTSTNTDVFTTTTSFLPTSGGSADLTATTIIPAEGSWYAYVCARVCVRNSGAGASALAAVQLVSDTGGAASLQDQAIVTPGNNGSATLTLVTIIGVTAGLTYDWRVRGMTTTGNFEWNGITTPPGAAEYVSCFSRIKAIIYRA